MRAAICAVFASAVLVATLGAQGRAPQIATTTLLESDAVHAGAALRAALQVAVADGLHIQSNKPRDPSLIPALLSFDAVPGVTVKEVVFPPSVDFTLQGSSQPAAVFEGTIAVGVVLEIAKNRAPGPVTIPAHFQYQACNESTCFPPKTADLSWTVTVVPAGAAITRAHAAVFKGIAFGHGEPPPAPSTASVTTTSPATPPGTSTTESGDVVQRFDHFTILGSAGGYLYVGDFTKFIHDAEAGVAQKTAFEGEGPLAILGLVFLGGLALNLTPCVLPMIPINLAIIGAGSTGAKRGRGFLLGGTYGLAMAVAYGVLGLVVILTAGSFGTINSSPWFNVGIAVLFVLLGLAMFDVISIDFSTYSSKIRFGPESRGTFVLAFGMGAVAALLAGACVAPVVVQVVVFSSNLYAGGTKLALGLPFVLGVGMAIPWPIAGAGFAALPKPGAWMVRVKQAMGVFILASAAYYGYVAYGIFASRFVDPASVQASVEAELKSGWFGSLNDGLVAAERNKTPVLIDMWATWCKNCLTMDETTMKDPAVTSALAGYTKIKLQAQDLDASPAKDLMKRVNAVGLPTYIILKPTP